MLAKSSAAGMVQRRASDLEHGFKAGVHFFFFGELAPLGGGYSFFHSGKETRFFVEITGNNLSHQALGRRSRPAASLRRR